MNDEHHLWTEEDKIELESQLILSTSEPLCLIPDPIVSIWKSKISPNKLEKSNLSLKRLRLAKKKSDYQLECPFKISKIRKHHLIETEFSNSTDNKVIKKFKSFDFQV